VTLGRAVFPIYGTQGEVVVTSASRLGAAMAAIEPVLAEIDQACSRFRSDSDLERVNRSPGRPVVVSRCLLDAVLVALHAARRTGGAVDPTIGQALVLLGYDRTFSELDPSSAGPTRPVFARVPGWEKVKVDRKASTITIPAGTRLDLGATAKAWAADRAAAAGAAAAACGVLVSLGGDVAMAGPAPEGGWIVQVSDWCGDELSPELGSVSVTGGGIATSSTTVRRWEADGEERHHLVDPSTGLSAEVVWRTVSVAAGSCVDANVAATAAIVKGAGAVDWLRSTGLPARLVRPGGGVVLVGRWPVPTVAA
jgi:thiamine biosynthesis lipoprotein